MIDEEINFKGHVDYAREEAANTSVSLARIVPALWLGVIRSALLYAALTDSSYSKLK